MVHQAKIKTFMLQNYKEFIDDCDELNMTALAEYTSEHFEEDPNKEIPEVYFETAFEVSEQTEN